MSIEWHITAAGGIVRREDHPEWTNARLREERVLRIGTRWLATAAAPPALVSAARLHARLGCVSAAQQLGLALLHRPDELHVTVARNATLGVRSGLHIHRSRPLLPVGRGELVESVYDMLAHVAGCLPRLEALIVWESAIHQGLVTKRQLERIPWRRPLERDLARSASDASESLLETLTVHRLRQAGLRVQQQVRVLGHRVDLLVEGFLVVQLDGFEHHRSAQRDEDIKHDARLLVEGVPVLRLGYAHVIREWPDALARIRAAAVQAPQQGRGVYTV